MLLWDIVAEYSKDILLQGAQLIFEKFIKPFMMQYASKIDPVFATAGRVIDSPQVRICRPPVPPTHLFLWC